MHVMYIKCSDMFKNSFQLLFLESYRLHIYFCPNMRLSYLVLVRFYPRIKFLCNLGQNNLEFGASKIRRG